MWLYRSISAYRFLLDIQSCVESLERTTHFQMILITFESSSYCVLFVLNIHPFLVHLFLDLWLRKMHLNESEVVQELKYRLLCQRALIDVYCIYLCLCILYIFYIYIFTHTHVHIYRKYLHKIYSKLIYSYINTHNTPKKYTA